MATGITRAFSLFCILLVLAACDATRATRLPAASTSPRVLSTAETGGAQVSRTATSDVRHFAETGHAIRGTFRTFWEQNGALSAFGLPLTDQLYVDGAMAQYFERARFEVRDGDITVGQLGVEALRASHTPVMQAGPRSTCQFFHETRHNLCPPLLAHWEQLGGVARLGLPIEEARHVDGVLIQHFERARVELPDGKLARLGNVGAEALERIAGGSMLRTADLEAAPIRVTIIGQTSSVQPLEQAWLNFLAHGYTGPAELLITDRRGTTGRYPLMFVDGAAQRQVEALGQLGSQAAIVLIGGQVAGVGTSALLLRAETSIETGQLRFDNFLPTVKEFMDASISRYVFDGHRVLGYRSPDSDLIWLRDHVHQGKGYAYWQPDMTSALDQFRRFQYPDGSFDDYIANKPWGLMRGRTEVEADLEYLFVDGVYRAWQATGDDAWLRRQIDAIEHGLHYIRTNPERWDTQHQLVKRPFTVDTWDFEYGPPTIAPNGTRAPRHWIDEQTKWSIFHGDNTGYAHSMELLARLYDHLGNDSRAVFWREQATGIIERLHALSWNGRFYRHMVHLTPVEVPGVDEEAQLSLSNAYALNRSGVGREQARAIIDEYYRRWKSRTGEFSEWYSIDPPFPAGSLSTQPGWGAGEGEYVNGGHMPLVGGELARGAFEHGQERYGFDILQRYHSLIANTGGSYLWYYPDGRAGISGPETLPTDGWGSSAMLAALIEGAAGVRDDDRLFLRATLAPRWSATTDVRSAEVVVKYGASEGYVAYQWAHSSNDLRLRWTGNAETVSLRLLLPADTPAELSVTVDDEPIQARVTTVGESRYLEAQVDSTGLMVVSW